MSLARALGIVISGIEAHPVEVEAHLSPGLPGMTIVGLGDAAVCESRDRVRAAIINSGARWPQQRITVGLSPAWLHKRGSCLDLAVASAILAADGQIPGERLQDVILFGELGLDGRVRPVRGAVVAAVAAARSGRSRLVASPENAGQAGVVPGVEPVGVESLVHWGEVLRGTADPAPVAPPPAEEPVDEMDLEDVCGQAEAVAGLEVAAVGGHHVAMIGRPGVGKTMLAQRLPTILPDLGDDDALVATAIRSVVSDSAGLVRRPPFQAPHHTATVPALVGGGRGGVPVPGAVTLAHAGVLFMDEAAEFGSACMEALRQPLEAGVVCIARAGFTVTMPARFQLVLAANPCPCGMGDGAGEQCRCRSQDRRRYLARLSGPVMDRIDIRLWLQPPGRHWQAQDRAGRSDAVLGRVRAAQERGRARALRLGLPPVPNRALPASAFRGALAPDPAAGDALSRAVAIGRLSARGADRVLRVAWSVADLEGVSRPGLPHVGQAMGLRESVSGGSDG